MPFLQPPAFPRISLPRPVPLFAHLPAALRAAHLVWCNFSSTAVSMGFQSVAVDHVPAKRWHVLQLDLREPGAQQLLSTLRCLLPALVVLAPPCGTASARDIPAYGNGKRIAHPLRSGQHPDGLPSLQGHDLARVTSANSLYAFAAAVAGMCSQHGIPWLIENPARS